MSAQTWPVVRYNGAHDNDPKLQAWTLTDAARWLCTPILWTRRKVDAPAWSPVSMRPGATRSAAGVASVSMLVLDCDAGESLDVLEALGDEYVRLAHTSWSHRPDHPKARLVFPFQRPCPAKHWERVWGAAARWAAAHGVRVDAATKDPSRLYFGPALPDDGPHGDAACNPRLEWWEWWAYGLDSCPRGMMPDRPRSLLSWARLAAAYPEPEPEPLDVDVIPASAGHLGDTEDARERRRRRFARGMLEHRCTAMVAAGEGGKGGGTGRNSRTFALARLVARLAAAGAMSEGEGVSTVEQAAQTAGLKQKEYTRAIRNGLAAGRADGPEDIDQYLTEDV